MSRVGNQLVTGSLAVVAGVVLVMAEALCAEAAEKNTGYNFPSAGLEAVLSSDDDDDLYVSPKSDASEELNIEEKIESEKERITSELAMANVSNTLNVRAEASEDSSKVGFLYRDCGGTILEQKDGWTKIKSGALTGWCKDEYLYLGEEAAKAADDVGRWLVTLKSEAVRMREEPSEDSEVMTILAKGDYADFVEIIDDEWISIDYGGDLGYVNVNYVDITFHIDEGETIEAVNARKAIEEELKKQAEEEAKKNADSGKPQNSSQTSSYTTETRDAVSADADELRLLAALIWCEAGNQSYDGMLAVGAVVMNRVKSPAYPNTIYSVIYASGQFTPAMSGKVAVAYQNGVPDTCTMAAAAALSGQTTVGDATHFRRNNGHEGIVIGAHVFW